jgi:hypothetical protein
MTRRTGLLDTANGQLAELHKLLSTRGQDALSLPCPGRENLGDGTIGATAHHLAHAHHQLARFIQAERAAPGVGSAGHRHTRGLTTTSTIANAPDYKNSCNNYQPPPARSAP